MAYQRFFLIFSISYLESGGLAGLERPLLKMLMMQYVQNSWSIPSRGKRRVGGLPGSLTSLDLKGR